MMMIVLVSEDDIMLAVVGIRQFQGSHHSYRPHGRRMSRARLESCPSVSISH